MSPQENKFQAMICGWLDGIRGGAKDSFYSLNDSDEIRAAYNAAHEIGRKDKIQKTGEFSAACGIKLRFFSDGSYSEVGIEPPHG